MFIDYTQINGELATWTDTDIMELIPGIPDGKTRTYYLGGQYYKGFDNLPHPNYAYGAATVFKRNSTSIRIVLWGGNSLDEPMWKHLMGETWSEWKKFSPEAENTFSGYFINKKYGDEIPLGRTIYRDSIVIAAPTYNTYTTMRCNFDSIRIPANSSSFMLKAWDLAVQSNSTSETLCGAFVVVPI